MKLSKGLLQRAHAMQRAAERAGIVLDLEMYNDIIREIRSSQSRPVERQSHRCTVHDVTVRGRVLRVVYDRKSGELVTFLDPDEEVRPWLKVSDG